MTSMTDPSFDKLALLNRFTAAYERLAPGTEVPAADVAHDLRRILDGTADEVIEVTISRPFDGVLAQVEAARRAASHVDDVDQPAPAGMFRAKPSSIDAVQWTGDPASLAACKLFAPDKIATVHGGKRDSTTELRLFAGAQGAQGWVPVPVGHWIVSQPGDRSDVWPVDPDYFAGKYEAAGEELDGPPAATSIGDSPGLEDVLDEFVKLLEKLAPGTDLPAASVASDLRRLLAGTA